jgi:hypothetical protein
MGQIITEKEAIEQAKQIVEEKLADWEYQAELLCEWKRPVIVRLYLTQLDRRAIYIIKGYVEVASSDNRRAGWLMGFGAPRIIMFEVELDAENGKILKISHLEGDWKLHPSMDNFDDIWKELSRKQELKIEK